MLGMIPTTDVLDMVTPDDEDEGEDRTVRDVLDSKRQNPDYLALLEDVRKNGITIPLFIRTQNGTPWLADGHHRVAIALDLGIDMVPWTDVPLDIAEHTYHPMMRGTWDGYRPAA